MNIREKGSPKSPTILFLHGNAATSNTWNLHFERLSQDYHCLAPDYPGFGKSNHLKWVSLDNTTDRVIQLIRERALNGRAHLVGLSLGGSIGINLLGKAPDLVDHAIIDGTGVIPFRSTPLLSAGFFLVQPFLKADFFIRSIADRLNISENDYTQFRDDFRRMSPSAFRRSFYQGMELRPPTGMERVTCRTLFVAGSEEFSRFHKSNRMMCQIMPNAECRVVPGLGHSWLFQNPDLHLRMVYAWITDQELPTELTPLPQD